MERTFNSIKDFTIEILRKDKDEHYAFRLLIYDMKTGKKVNDRTFVSANEHLLMLKFTGYLTKQRLLRRITPQKVKLRIVETSNHLIPLWFFAKIEKETNGRIFLKGEETEEKISVN